MVRAWTWLLCASFSSAAAHMNINEQLAVAVDAQGSQKPTVSQDSGARSEESDDKMKLLQDDPEEEVSPLNVDGETPIVPAPEVDEEGVTPPMTDPTTETEEGDIPSDFVPLHQDDEDPFEDEEDDSFFAPDTPDESEDEETAPDEPEPDAPDDKSASDEKDVCFKPGYTYKPVQMAGTKMSKAKTIADCQSRCKDTPGCATFAYYPNRRCHLQDSDAKLTRSKQRGIAGLASCAGFEATCLKIGKKRWGRLKGKDGKRTKETSAAACLARCARVEKCGYFTWYWSGSCKLYYGSSKEVGDRYAVSGEVDCIDKVRGVPDLY